MGDIKNFVITLHTYDQRTNDSITINVQADDVFSAFQKARDILNKDGKSYKIITGGSIDLAK